MATQPIIFSWSGGKDSALALYYLTHKNIYSVSTLLTNVSQKYLRVSMHGVHYSLLEEQAKALKLPLHKVYLPEHTNSKQFEVLTQKAIQTITAKSSIPNTIAYGDIFLEDLKQYRIELGNAIGMNSLFPLWKRDTKDLIKQCIDLGFKTIIVSLNTHLLPEYLLGRSIDKEVVKILEQHSVDVCGENGEFHTFVYDGPIFNKPVSFMTKNITRKNYTTKTTDGKTITTPFSFLELCANH